jgi:hypothetical protein
MRARASHGSRLDFGGPRQSRTLVRPARLWDRWRPTRAPNRAIRCRDATRRAAGGGAAAMNTSPGTAGERRQPVASATAGHRRPGSVRNSFPIDGVFGFRHAFNRDSPGSRVISHAREVITHASMRRYRKCPRRIVGVKETVEGLVAQATADAFSSARSPLLCR